MTFVTVNLENGKGKCLEMRHKSPLLEVLRVTITNCIGECVSNLYGTITIAYRYSCAKPLMIYNRSRDKSESVPCMGQLTLKDLKNIKADDEFFFFVNLKNKGLDESSDTEIAKGKFADCYIYDEPVTEIIYGPYCAVQIDYVVVREAISAVVKVKHVSKENESVDLSGRVTLWSSKFSKHEIVLLDTRSESVRVEDSIVPLCRSIVVVPSGSFLTVKVCLQNCNDISSESSIAPNNGLIVDGEDTAAFGSDTILTPHRTSKKYIYYKGGQFEVTVKFSYYGSY